MSEPLDRRESLGDLLDHCFQVPAGRHYFDDFPIWDPTLVPAGPSLKRIGVRDRDRLIASAGVKLVDLRPSGPRLDSPGAGGPASRSAVKAALIGAVATDPAFRGRGHASALVTELCEFATNSGAEVALLWGSEHKLYERLGFQLAGEQTRVPLENLEFDEPAKGIRMGWSDAIFELLLERTSGAKLQAQDLTWYRAHAHVDWYRTEEDGKVTAYAGVNRGIDLTNMIHEWGGPAIGPLIAKLKQLQPRLELLGPSALEFLRPHPREFLALMKPLGPSKDLPKDLWVWGLDAV